MSASDWIETSTGNRISKTAEISHPKNVIIGGNVTINQGVKISIEPESKLTIGKFSYFYPNVQLTPTTHDRAVIGGYVIIGQNTTISSSKIGNRVIIEENCDIRDNSVIYDCCLIKKNTIIPPRMVIPPYSEVSGIPGENFKIKPLHNSYKKSIELESKQLQILNPS